MKKPFKETKLGKFLTEKIPDSMSMIADVLPDKGALGIVKNIIDKASMSAEDKREAFKLMADMELEIEKLTAADRASARDRERDYVRTTGHADWMMMFVGFIGLAAFVFYLYVLVYVTVPAENKTLFDHGLGIVEGVSLSIFAYYFGSSKGSADKNKMLKG